MAHSDPYLNPGNCLRRLRREVKEHGSLVIAVDFDGTLHDYHGVGDTYPKLISIVQRAYYAGFHIIIFTANEDTSKIKAELEAHEVPYNSINENPPFYKSDKPTTKIYYNLLLDDRAGLYEAYNALDMVLESLGH